MFLYNPDKKSKADLINEFVVRTTIYDDIMKDMESSAMVYPEQHYLLVGQRGAGKTTLLSRIRYGVDDSPALHSWLIPVLFSEEQYNISELVNLWENIGQYLEDYQGFTGIYAEMEKGLHKANFEEYCYEILEKNLKEKGKKIVILIDNIGDLLKKLDKLEIHRLREILQSKNEIRLIAGSPFHLDSLLDYQQPFFEFFKTIRLDGLNRQETENLLLKISEIEGKKDRIEKIIHETPQRIEVLRTLTDGVPRTIVLMFGIFMDDEHADSIKDLEKILDAVTPLYKHRMDDLPKQQQKIIDAVARNWDPISVKDLVDKTRLESKIISSQLRQLEKEQIIEKRQTNTKNNLYLIRERFWNIWFLMRYGRKENKERVRWVVKFLESWCDDGELESRILEFAKNIKQNSITEENLSFFGDAYSLLQNLTLQAKATLKLATPQQSNSITVSSEEYKKLAREAFQKKDYSKTLLWIAHLEQLTDDEKKIALQCIGSFQQNIYDLLEEVLEFLVSPKTINDNTLLTRGNILLIIRLCMLCMLSLSANVEVAANMIFETVNDIFDTIASLYVIFIEINTRKPDLGIETKLLILSLNQMYHHNLIQPILKYFDKEYEKFGIKVDFKIILEPIYFALQIITGQKEFFQISPEKEKIVRKIVAQITQKID